MKKITIILFLLSICFFLQAKKTSGFIITANMDTVFGEIKLHKFERATGAFLINGFDLNWCFFSVSFKGKGENKFKNYKPFELYSYQFTYNSIIYEFKSFEVYFTRLISQKDQVPRFLQLMVDGKISLYRDMIYAPQIAESAKFYSYYDYYLFNLQKGLVKVEATDYIKTVKDLLREFKVEEEFINSLAQGIRFKDLGLVLKEYNTWLSNK